MSEREPITAELRDKAERYCNFKDDNIVKFTEGGFDRLCDAIDAVHAGLERENAELRERLAVLDNRSESMHIGEATVTITPTLDWTGVARELRAIAATLGATDANPTQAESSGTCHDVGDPSDFCCSECGVRMFTDTSDTYTMIASDGRTIIKHPNYCPNCGRRIEQ